MPINKAKFERVVEEAKAKAANDPKWLRAIEKAIKAILSGEMIVTVLAHGALITTSGGTYAANGHCNCEAARRGHTQCYHRAAARLMDLYETAVLAVSVEISSTTVDEISTTFTADVAASPRANLIAEINNIWPRFAHGIPLYTELLARFGKSDLNMLDDDSLRRVRLAIAM